MCARLLARHPELKLSVSTTTRTPREGEQDGVDYDFVTGEEFDAMIAADDFVEWAEVHGNRYGTSKKRIRGLQEQGYDVLFDVDVQGAQSLKRVFGAEANTVMLLPPSMEELERRLRGRGTDPEGTIRQRLRNSAGELERWRSFDSVVVNDDIDEAVADLETLLRGERIAPERAELAARRLFGADP